jgi:isopentenyldiphosphate isomerase
MNLLNNTQTDTSVITKLAQMPKIDYDRVRKQTAKELGIQIKTFDDEVKLERIKTKANSAPTNGVLFKEIGPWQEFVDVGVLLNELTNIFRRFVVLPECSDILMVV